MSTNLTAQKIEQGASAPKMQVVKNEKTTPKTEANKETLKAEEHKFPTIEEIKRKNEVLRRLTERYDSLQDKRRRVENFHISHDRDTATVTVEDASGEVFESNSPKTIGKLIDFWKEEFNSALADLEKEIRETV